MYQDNSSCEALKEQALKDSNSEIYNEMIMMLFPTKGDLFVAFKEAQKSGVYERLGRKESEGIEKCGLNGEKYFEILDNYDEYEEAYKETMTKVKTEKKMFEAYEKVRKEGEYNMILNATGAMNAAGLDRDEYFDVVNNYTDLCAKYITAN